MATDDLQTLVRELLACFERLVASDNEREFSPLAIQLIHTCTSFTQTISARYQNLGSLPQQLNSSIAAFIKRKKSSPGPDPTECSNAITATKFQLRMILQKITEQPTTPVTPPVPHRTCHPQAIPLAPSLPPTQSQQSPASFTGLIRKRSTRANSALVQHKEVEHAPAPVKEQSIKVLKRSNSIGEINQTPRGAGKIGAKMWPIIAQIQEVMNNRSFATQARTITDNVTILRTETENLAKSFQDQSDLSFYNVGIMLNSTGNLNLLVEYLMAHAYEHAPMLKILAELQTFCCHLRILFPESHSEQLQTNDPPGNPSQNQDQDAAFWKTQYLQLYNNIKEAPNTLNQPNSIQKLDGLAAQAYTNLPVISNKKTMFAIEPETEETLPPIQLNIIEDLYAKSFYQNDHTLLWAHNPKKNEFSVFAILNEPTSPQEYEAIQIHKKGYTKVTLKDPSSMRVTSVANRGKTYLRFMKILQLEFPDFQFYHFKDYDIVKPLVKAIEEKSPQKKQQLTIAVVLCLPGQTNPHEMFKNTATPNFNNFLESMDIHLTDKEANKTKSWESLQIKYLVATQLNSDEHRRDVGNSPAFIFFKEGSQQFDASEIDKLGMVPQIFTVAQKAQRGYKIGFFRSGNVHPHSPNLPKNYCFEDKTILKNFILTKIHNGYVQFFSVASLSQNFFAARTEALASLEKYKKTK